MNKTLKQAAAMLRHHADKLSPIRNVQAVSDHADHLIKLARELDRMADVEPVAWQDTHKSSEIYEHDQLDPQWRSMMRPLYAAPPENNK